MSKIQIVPPCAQSSVPLKCQCLVSARNIVVVPGNYSASSDGRLPSSPGPSETKEYILLFLPSPSPSFVFPSVHLIRSTLLLENTYKRTRSSEETPCTLEPEDQPFYRRCRHIFSLGITRHRIRGFFGLFFWTSSIPTQRTQTINEDVRRAPARVRSPRRGPLR